MAKRPWAGKHVHDYDAVIIVKTGEFFESKTCAVCGEHRFVTRVKTALAKIGLR